jgi:hypothetical protein
MAVNRPFQLSAALPPGVILPSPAKMLHWRRHSWRGDMKNPTTCIAFSVALVLAPAIPAHAQEAPAAPADAAAPATDPAAASECKLAQAPGRLRITMPAEPVKPACAAKGNCSKAVADKFNAEITSYNKFMTKVNEAASAYVDELNAYTRDAGRYSSCEIDRLNAIVVK